MDSHSRQPLARTEGLVVQELGDESLVYDRESDVAHCLSSVAARVWRGCDGARDLDALAAFAGASQALVADAVDELREKNLLAGEPPTDGSPAPGVNVYGVNRRQALGRLAKMGAGAAAIPLIVSAMAASPASAASVGPGAPCGGVTGNTCLAPFSCGTTVPICGGTGASCTVGTQCLSTICTAGSCT